MLNSLAKNLLTIHDAGFIHRDLHPGNVLILSEIKTIISDFGLAKLIHDSSNSEVIGVMPYLAPEVLEEQPYRKAADIYAFSMLMWEICYGRPPLSQEDHSLIL